MVAVLSSFAGGGAPRASSSSRSGHYWYLLEALSAPETYMLEATVASSRATKYGSAPFGQGRGFGLGDLAHAAGSRNPGPGAPKG